MTSIIGGYQQKDVETRFIVFQILIKNESNKRSDEYESADR